MKYQGIVEYFILSFLQRNYEISIFFMKENPVLARHIFHQFKFKLELYHNLWSILQFFSNFLQVLIAPFFFFEKINSEKKFLQLLRCFYTRRNVSRMLRRHRLFLLLHMRKSFIY